MIYIHVPFCKSRCIYCDFYSTTCPDTVRTRYVEAACAELAARKDYLPEGPIRSIYLGGGTPSLLSAKELDTLFACISKHYNIAADAEVTLESNPDDISGAWIDERRNLGINRVSLGVQSFQAGTLQLLNRRHSAEQAVEAVNMLHDRGLNNISIDLIYGLPGQTADEFHRDLETAFSLPVKHLSTYALSIEEGTPLAKMVAEGHVTVTDEEVFLKEYEDLMRMAEQHGFEHYEISNFALPGYASRHNSAYWDGTPYIGIGPGAHSYDGTSRRYNHADLDAYIHAHANPPHSIEEMTVEERFDEMVFTALRTRAGLDLTRLRTCFGHAWTEGLMLAARPHLTQGRLVTEGGRLRLTRQGIFVSDDIMSDLMRA